jgi:thiol-disulfide isomerase/thioredoxin
VQSFGDRVTYEVEDLGASPLSDRFGIYKYPAVFVDDALVARPEEFFAWDPADTSGKYVPWSELENRREFQDDLRRMIEIRLAGGELESAAPHRAAESSKSKPLPAVPFTALDGTTHTFSQLAGKPVLVEFWAPWCPPCLSTLSWLRGLDPKTFSLVAIAVESKLDAVEALLEDQPIPGIVTMATPELLEAFGGVPAIPTLLVADREGRVVKAFYGAPPDLHQQIEAELAKLGDGRR